jgi:hypothetical protein
MYVPRQIPEGNEVPQLWPQVVLTKLTDPQRRTPQPLVVLQGITLLGGAMSDSVLGTTLAARRGALIDTTAPNAPRPTIFTQDHLTVVLRPSVICFPSPYKRGILVVPHPVATAADLDCSSTPCVPVGMPDQPIAPPKLAETLAAIVSETRPGCLPTGRYAINVVYPNGQAWTVPNEAGTCSPSEACSRRPVLTSQGNRAVVEVVAAQDASYCDTHQVPECLASQ